MPIMDYMKIEQRQITFIIGASGSGKSRHAAQAAQSVNGFIIDPDKIKLALNSFQDLDAETNEQLHPSASQLSKDLLGNYFNDPEKFLARYKADSVLFDNRGKDWNKVQNHIKNGLNAGLKVKFIYVENSLASCLLNVYRRNKTSSRAMKLSVVALDYAGTVATAQNLKFMAAAGAIELEIVSGYESIKSTFIKRIIGFSLSKLMRK
jgi:ABC-type dipeptide/oligopeptide/nickel transport system ATPase component